MAELEAIVLAGGLGTRLRAVVPEWPKVLAPVAGRPFLDYICRYLERAGIDTVAFALGYKAQMVEAWLASQTWSFRTRIFVEKEPLGTGGAIGHAMAGLSAENVLVLNGDTYVDAPVKSFLAYHQKHGGAITVATVYKRPADRYGTLVLVEDRVVAFTEKAAQPEGWINAGLYAICRGWWLAQGFPEAFSWEAYLQKAVQAQPPLALWAYRLYDRPFIDIGVPTDYERAQTYLPAYFR